ncbi:MAG: hypothetical protein PHP28_04300 [Actinomycetota bacterium]|nr:hypothetical protein [Actinomycetota bacterium]MDD5665737.1 hypothetical protein [Actinomycetota bacterium]
MSKNVKTVLSIVAVILILGSTVGLILTIAADSGGGGEVKLEVQPIPREEIVTAAYKAYGDDQQNLWAAKTLIRNVGDVPVNDFRIDYKIEGYCDWTSAEVYPTILPGQTVRDYCWPNLDGARMKEITSKTPVELTVRYSYEGLAQPIQDQEKIYLLGRNDFVFTDLGEEDILTFTDAFDNYPMIAAFVTPNEDYVKSVANTMAGGLETGMNDDDVYTAFIRCFDGMRAMGVKYIQEPLSYWSERTAQYVQYPAETLSRASGTCLDLAICMAALMEAVGIKSYVALIPGHAIPVIELPNSGDMYAIESTFIDQEYALSHFPGETSPEVTASECINIAADEINAAMEEGSYILIDIRKSWQQGVMPIW